jgi:hypothetical protein
MLQGRAVLQPPLWGPLHPGPFWTFNKHILARIRMLLISSCDN